LFPEDLPRLFAEAWNARNAQALANLFAEDAEFVNVVGLWWHNRDDIYKAHEYGLRVIFHASELKVTKIAVKQLTDEVAVVHARMRLRGQTAHGNVQTPADRYNLFSFVVQKLPQGWLCVSAHNTDIMPGAETNLATDDKITPTNYRS